VKKMEATLEFEMMRETSVAEMVAEGGTKELDDILEEVVNLAETLGSQNLAVDTMVAAGEEAVDETDFALQTGDYLELEIDVPMEATEPHAQTTPLAEETESALDALIDVENEGMAALAKEAGAHDPGDSFPQSSGAQLTDVLSKKIEATIARLVEERLSGIVERSLAEKLKRILANI
jgi:hypothetical protein